MVIRTTRPSPAETAGRAPVRALTLELTKGCNLRCGYCYYAEREDAYQPATRMTADVAAQSVDLLFDDTSHDDAVHLHFFGGEPLMNFPLLRRTVEYAEERSAATGRAVTFEVTTNGTLLTEAVVRYLNEHDIKVGVSFDGPPEIQDAARPSGRGSSYALAIPGIERLLASRRGTPLADKTHCSVVVTRRDLDLHRIVSHLEDLGFRTIILTPATDLTGETHGVRPEDIDTLLAAYDALAVDYESRLRRGEPTAATWFPSLMRRLESGTRRTQPCQGGRDYLGVAADGKAYLCYRFYEEEDFAMGSVADGIDRTVTDRLDAHTMDQRTACSTCWARHFCGGGCHHDNLVSGGGLGDPNPVTCSVFRHTMGRVLEIRARLDRTPIARSTTDPGETSMPDAPTPFTDDDRPLKNGDCHAQQLDEDERVVYDPGEHEVVVLNETACFIVDLADGSRTVTEILAALESRYDAPREALRTDLLDTLADLATKGVITRAA